MGVEVMANSHNSGYFPGGSGLVNATGDMITVSPASALSGNVLTLPSGGSSGTSAAYSGAIDSATFTVPGGVSTSFNIESTRVYRLTNFGGGLNFTGNTGADDYPAWARMVTQILSDASAYGEQRYGFHAIIELGAHVHNWSSGSPTITVPANSAGTGSSLGNVILHVTIRYHGSTHYMSNSNGFFISGYTCASRVYFQGVANFYNANQNGQTACAIGKGATAGISATAYFAAAPLGVGAGVCNFQSDEIFVQDTTYLPNGVPTPTPISGSNAGVLTFNAAVDVGGLCTARISRVTYYGVAAAASSGHGSIYPGSAAIIIRGCNIQCAIYDTITEYRDCAVSLRCYVESLYLYKAGGSNTNRGIYTDTNRTDFSALYSDKRGGNTYFVGMIMPDVESDANFSCIDLERASQVRIYGGNYWMHAEENGAYNGQVGNAGDVAGNAPIIFRGCSGMMLMNAFIKGPSKDSYNANDGTQANPSQVGPNTSNNVKGVILKQSYYNNVTGTGVNDGPPNGTVNCSGIDIAGCEFAGYTANGNLSPIYVDPTDLTGTGNNPHIVGKLQTRHNRWFPPPYVDGYVVGSLVSDPNSNNYHVNYSGAGTVGSAPSFQAILVNGSGTKVS